MRPEEEGKLIEQQNRGAAAENALNLVHEAFEDVKKQMFDAWMASPLRDEKGREKLWISTTLLSRVENVIRKRVMDGQLARAELEALRKAGERRFALPTLGQPFI